MIPPPYLKKARRYPVVSVVVYPLTFAPGSPGAIPPAIPQLQAMSSLVRTTYRAYPDTLTHVRERLPNSTRFGAMVIRVRHMHHTWYGVVPQLAVAALSRAQCTELPVLWFPAREALRAWLRLAEPPFPPQTYRTREDAYVQYPPTVLYP